jgi:hypothetical protein
VSEAVSHLTCARPRNAPLPQTLLTVCLHQAWSMLYCAMNRSSNREPIKEA